MMWKPALWWVVAALLLAAALAGWAAAEDWAWTDGAVASVGGAAAWAESATAWAEQRIGLDLSPGLLAWAGAGYVVKVAVVYGAYRYWKAWRRRRIVRRGGAVLNADPTDE